MKYIFTGIALFLLPTLASCGVILPEATLTVRVVGEDDDPIADATVGVGFELPYGVNEPYRATLREAVTGESGSVTFTEKTSGQVSYGATKDGYYRTIGDKANFTPQRLVGKALVAEGKIVLRRIGNPIAMYAKKVDLAMPALEGPVGFDLAIGDWVAPHGRGQVSDLVFTAHLQQRSKKDYDYELLVTFSNREDGLQVFEAPRFHGSEFKSPRFAPEDGYLPEWRQFRKRASGQAEISNVNEARNFLVRVRTVVDAKGEIVSALYGKIYGDFLRFTHYLNPTVNDRNMEFDPQHNLFRELKSTEQVSNP